MRHGALFNGIGGFQLAAHWMGWENVMHCEIDEFCNKVVKKHFPNSIRYGDIRETDFTQCRGAIDILTGGFPCQPFSDAGKRKGTADNRHLWPENLRAIKEIQPCWIVGENVRGLTNWNGGLVFDQVQADLEAEGYEVLPFLLPACAVNAPHRRDRIWFVAHSGGFDIRQTRGTQAINAGRGEMEKSFKERSFIREESASTITGRYVTDSDHEGIQGRSSSGNIEIEGEVAEQFVGGYNQFDYWQNFPTQPCIRGGDDGISRKLDEDRLKALGNAIVPYVALQIFKAIEQYEVHTK